MSRGGGANLHFTSGLQTFRTMTELMTPQAIIQNVCDSLFLSGLIVLYRVVMA